MTAPALVAVRDLDPPRPGPDRRAAWLVAAVATALYTVFAVTQWRLLESPSWDLGIFTQLAQRYSRLEAPIAAIKGEGFHLLGDHFHPILVLLGPVYAVVPSGLTLLVVQAVLLGLSAVPVTTVARERLGAARGTWLGAAYALSWGLTEAVAVQFHEIAFAVPLLAFALAAFLRGRWWACAAWAAPLVFVKEDLGLTMAALGAVLVLRAGAAAGPVARRAGLALTVWGLAWFVLAIWVILPAFNPGGTWDYYDRLGEEGGELTAGAILESLTRLFVPGEKYLTLLLLVLAAGVIGLRSPLVWLWLPTLAWRFAGNVEHYWGWQWHYSAVLMPVALAALIDVAGDRPGRTGLGHLGRPRRQLPRRWATAAVTAAVATTVATTALMAVTGPMARLAEPSTYAGTWRADGAAEAIAAVEEGSIVETDIYLMAYLVPRAEVYWIGNPGNPPPDHVVLDAMRGGWTDTVPDAAAYAELRHDATYEVVLDVDGYQVATRVR